MKKFWAKCLCVALTASMVFSAVGCGKKGEGGINDTGVNSQGGTAMTQEEKAKQAAEGVFSVNDLELKFDGETEDDAKGDNYNIVRTVIKDNNIQMIASVYEGNSNSLYSVTCDMDGSNVQTVRFEDPFAGDLELGELDGGYAYLGYSGVAISDNGMVYAIRNYSRDDYENYENSIQEYYVDAWNADGQFVSEYPIQGIGYDEVAGTYRYVRDAMTASDGSVMYVVSGDKFEYFVLAADGEPSDYMPLKLDQKLADKIDSFIAMGEGKAAITYWNDDWTKMMCSLINLETGAVEKEAEVPGSVASMGFYNVYKGTNSDFVYGNGVGIYTLNIGDTEPKKLMDFINSDVSVSNINSICQMNEDTFMGMYYDDVEWRNHISIFTKVPEDKIVTKEVITLAGMYLQYDSVLKKRIIDFNKTNPNFRISIKDYSEYNTDDDYSAGVTRLNNDIAANRCPDILKVNEEIPIESYSKKGLFADIDELIAADPELSKNEYLENVFEAFRVDGKLYRVIPTFYVQTKLAKKELVGDRDSITMEECDSIVKGLGKDATIFGSTYSRESFVSEFMAYCGNDFIDKKTGKCSFDSDEFKTFLTKAKDFPKSDDIDYSGYDESYWAEQVMQYRNNKTLLYSAYFGSLTELKYTIQGQIGGDVSYVGYPSAQNGGAAIGAGDYCFALNAKSEYLQGSWDFIKYYLSDEYQSSEDRWGCPVLKSAVKSDLQKNTEKNVYVDEITGEEYNYDNFWTESGEIPYEPMSQAQVDAFYNYICSITNTSYADTDVMNIINEEAEAFFVGQKPVEEVVKIIQSKVQLYINEQ